MSNNQNNHLTTSWGAPVGDNQNSMTAGQRGPTLLQDVHLLENWHTLIVSVCLSALCTQKVPEHMAILK